jgi:hypothetical protein
MKMVISLKKRKMRSGAASLEAVILLPVFILIFAGIQYVETLWENKQQALLQARKCAWLYANAGCDQGQLPPDCVRSTPDADGLPERNALAESTDGGVLDGLTDVPLIGPAIEGLFANAFNSLSSREIQPPPLLGERAFEVVGIYYLMCNERERDMLDLFKGAFCSFVSDASGCQ